MTGPRRFQLVVSMIAAIVIGPMILASAPATFAAPGEERAVQRPIFKKRKIILGTHTLNVEIADTDDRRAFGLMFREKMGRDEGMLFIFEDEQKRTFWMQNTLIPLSIGYFSRTKVLNEVIDMQPAVMGATRPRTYPSGKKAMYALEMNIGWYERNKIRPGVSFRFADN